MSDDTYDVDTPGPRPHPNPPSTGPACPHCGGVVVPVLGSRVCNSCARVIGRARR